MKFQIKKEGLSGEALKFAELMESALGTAFEDATKGVITEDALTAKLEAFFQGKGLSDEERKQIKDTADAVREQAIKMQKFEDNGINNKITTEEQLIKELETKKDRFREIRKQGHGFEEFVIKVPAVTTIAGSITDSVSAATNRRNGGAIVNEIKRGTPFILDYVNLGQTDSRILIWFDETPKDGDFLVTAEGVTKPLIQYKFTRKSTDYKKAAGYTVLTDEFDRDFKQLVTTIRRLLLVDCRLKVNDLVYADLIAAAPAYTYTGLNGAAGIDNADNFAAVGAATTQIQNLYFNPNVLIQNPADKTKMSFVKDSTGQWVVNPLPALFPNLEASFADPRVAAGNFLLGDLNMFNVDLLGDVIVRVGYNGTDLIQNQYTVVVEQYFYDYMSANRAGAMFYGTYASIKTAIETP